MRGWRLQELPPARMGENRAKSPMPPSAPSAAAEPRINAEDGGREAAAAQAGRRAAGTRPAGFTLGGLKLNKTSLSTSEHAGSNSSCSPPRRTCQDMSANSNCSPKTQRPAIVRAPVAAPGLNTSNQSHQTLVAFCKSRRELARGRRNEGGITLLPRCKTIPGAFGERDKPEERDQL